MDQLTLGDEQAQKGMDAAVAATHSGVVAVVDYAIDAARSRYAQFTSDHVRRLLYIEHGANHIDIGRIIGARMNSAARRGDIASTGMTVKSTRPDAHSRRLLVWENVR